MCEVTAQPSSVTFHWRFNNSGQSVRLDTYSWEGTKSVARYVAKTPDDYGTVLCWARNQIGDQKQPCIFMIVPAGKFVVLRNPVVELVSVSVVVCKVNASLGSV